jgi:flagellum-specific peptidoglycan hydrolase FlgJ
MYPLKFLGILLALSLGFSVAAVAAEFPYYVVDVRKNSGLNVRMNPGKNSEWVWNIPDATPVQVVGEINGWYQLVHVPGITCTIETKGPSTQPCYVHAKYLKPLNSESVITAVDNAGKVVSGSGKGDRLCVTCGQQMAGVNNEVNQDLPEIMPIPPQKPDRKATRTNECVEYDVNMGAPSGLGKNSSNTKPSKFFEYMMPLAVHLQTHTGMPASMILAQAALESGYGTSYGFRNRHAAFGQMCGGTRSVSLTVGDETRKIATGCEKTNTGKWATFSSVQDSTYAYIHNILEKDATAFSYRELRKLLKEHIENQGGKIPPASWRDVLPALKRYSEGFDEYTEQVKWMINRFDLDKYDKKVSCQ